MKEKITLESIFSEQNMEKALHTVTKRNAMPGLDGMKAAELPTYWEKHRKRKTCYYSQSI